MQGRRKLPKAGWASSNVAFYSAKTWVGNCPPILYAPVVF